jgi:hypothetical protein
MTGNFEYTTNPQYKVKSLTAQLDAFRSGEKYLAMQSRHKAEIAAKNRGIRGLKSELAAARREVPNMARKWMQVFDDLEKEHAKALRRKDSDFKAMEGRALGAERQRDEALDRLKAKNSELYRVKTELEEEKGKNLKLTAQVNRDFENSSIPSSLKPNHKKIQNSREKSGKPQGGQLGHTGHTRKRQIPARRIAVPAPLEYINNPLYKPTGKVISKQIVNVRVNLDVTEYFTPEFRNMKTGQRVHAAFPEGLSEEVTYGAGVKALAFLLNNHCNVSIDKTRGLLLELTGGALEISKGMGNGLCGEFAASVG